MTEPVHDRRVVFGEAAEQYDAARPGYPDQLVDEVLHFAGSDRIDALEVGAGTGKATLAFAARPGISLTCLEPDPRMAAVLTRNCTRHPHVTIRQGDFETWSASDDRPRPFDLILSAQAWHWIDPEARWTLAKKHLRPGGTLALFWNDWYVADDMLRHALTAAHHRHLPELPSHSVLEKVPRGSVMVPDSWVPRELLADGGFTDVTHRQYPSAHRRSTSGFLDLLSSLSFYRCLPAVTRDALLADVALAVDAHGGSLRLDTRTGLFLARTARTT
ncbi:class I SAM-dependent methyltransferase [Streptomyces sp. AV19]|uniref:class I SAM-dependent methyltransferase n=1 Tax=Streptomyces sp. AV19 TaxID=2793068 RepID=UPI0018FE12B0|nr:class I SAM-dependent methyltransferase [Streptomyces sp. AV19]MBH1933642.1 class I SAM-dependent methyltransferase [Streptomyces sp. AV19]MDG4535852.1 class I SAM-dependent methyltransferase [Streptomyces sp. AV19]